MCEFCTAHGEGKIWYLQMKNYAEELLHQELSASQKAVTGFPTRYDWHEGFWQYFIMPAITGSASQPKRPLEAQTSPPAHRQPPTREESIAHSKVEHFGQVLPIEDVEKVIDMVDSITRMPCGCRFFTTGKTDRRYCFGFGIDQWGFLGKYPDESASLEVLDKDEARKIFRRFDEEGLIHSIWTGVTPYVVGMCNCDRDCGAYKNAIEMRGAPNFFRGETICQVDWDQCTGCKECMKQCQFGAQFYSSALGKVYIDPTRCYGCGVCRSACVNDAITTIPRKESSKAAELWL
jgi:ferredoxin